MHSDLIISIQPQYVEQIKQRKKVHEFRNFKARRPIDKFWIYESAPSSALKYVAHVELPIEYPAQLEVQGEGDEHFNRGELDYKYAYRITHLYQLDKPLRLPDLRARFRFSAPQSFCYAERYAELMDYIQQDVSLKKIF